MGAARDAWGDAKRGAAWTKVKTWFGYGLPPSADTRYEVPVGYRVTRALRSEVKELDAMVEEVFEGSPELARRCQDFGADRGLDSGPLKAKRWQVRPLIEPRELWREEKAMPAYDPTRPITRALYPQHAEGGQEPCALFVTH